MIAQIQMSPNLKNSVSLAFQSRIAKCLWTSPVTYPSETTDSTRPKWYIVYKSSAHSHAVAFLLNGINHPQITEAKTLDSSLACPFSLTFPISQIHLKHFP